MIARFRGSSSAPRYSGKNGATGWSTESSPSAAAIPISADMMLLETDFTLAGEAGPGPRKHRSRRISPWRATSRQRSRGSSAARAYTSSMRALSTPRVSTRRTSSGCRRASTGASAPRSSAAASDDRSVCAAPHAAAAIAITPAASIPRLHLIDPSRTLASGSAFRR